MIYFFQLEVEEPLSEHQQRILKSLEKVSVPSWFKISNQISSKANHSPKRRPGWSQYKNSIPISTEKISNQASSTYSRESSTCPSFISSYSRFSGGLPSSRYRGIRDTSVKSCLPALDCGNSSYRQPYLGWRQTQHQSSESHNSSFILSPTQRLARTAAQTS